MTVHNTPIDVIVPVRNDFEKLRICCKALRARIPVHHLIISASNVGEMTRRVVTDLADIPLFDESFRGAGAARALGLLEVDTEFYGSIDADVIISAEWYPRCIRIMGEPSVAACQGYQKPVGKLCARWYEEMNRRGHCDQGNTMLRTEMIRAVGMPLDIQEEDAVLRGRLEELGYKWIVDSSLPSTHLQTDLEFFHHWYWYGKLQPMNFIQFTKYIVWLTRWAALQTTLDPLQKTFVGFLLNLTRAFGSLAGEYGHK